jgi:hypothetical protein
VTSVAVTVSWQPCKTWLELRNTRDVQTVHGEKNWNYFMRLPIKLHLHIRSQIFFFNYLKKQESLDAPVTKIVND